MKFVISKACYAQVIAHCRREFPKEACGFLSGQGERIRRVFEMANEERSPIGYTMDPEEQLLAMKTIRQLGENLAAVYHSHTASEAYPSPVDVRLAVYPEAFFVVVSLQASADPALRAFQIFNERIFEADVQVVE